MSTSLLYHGLGLRGYRYRSTEYLAGEIVFTIDQDPKFWRCAACGAADVRPKGRNPRELCAATGREGGYDPLRRSTGALPQMRRHPAGKGQLCRAAASLHESFCTLRPVGGPGG